MVCMVHGVHGAWCGLAPRCAWCMVCMVHGVHGPFGPEVCMVHGLAPRCAYGSTRA